MNFIYGIDITHEASKHGKGWMINGEYYEAFNNRIVSFRENYPPYAQNVYYVLEQGIDYNDTLGSVIVKRSPTKVQREELQHFVNVTGVFSWGPAVVYY